jgi:16S rRNA (guanine966-N2)-methyltransferase
VTRVIAGSAGGRRIAVPAGRGTRPTSDRAREGLFATALSLLGTLEDIKVLDLYAGSGAVGLESLSRGSRHALMVESDPRAVRAIKANITALALPGAAVIADRVERVLSRPRPSDHGGGDHHDGDPGHGRARGGHGPGRGGGTDGSAGDRRPYDFVFADPPYAFDENAVGRMLTALHTGGWLAEGALVCVERPARGGSPDWPDGYVTDRVRRYGDAALWYGRAASPQDSPSGPPSGTPWD